MQASYRRLRFSLPPEREELVVAELWSAGTLGLETRLEEDGSLTAVAFFADPPTPEVSELETRAWGAAGVELVAADRLPAEDWMAVWRARSRPFPLGRGLLIDPREPEEGEAPCEASRRLLRIPARMAFGVGSHPSTRLVVELMEGMPVAGSRVLDVGTGTGILAFVAAVFGAAGVVAVEVDVESVVEARRNRHLNQIPIALLAGGVGALAPGTTFDLVLVNVLPERVAHQLPTLARLVRRGGRAIFSGIPQEEGERVAARLGELGLRRLGDRGQEGWVAIDLERSAE